MNKFVRVFAVCLAVLYFMFCTTGCSFIETLFDGSWYTVTDVNEYGIIYDDDSSKSVETFFKSFFPETIEPYFDDVSYKYYYGDYCIYRCEITLEFTVSDKNEFIKCVEQYTKGKKGTPFLYDNRYTDYIIYDDLYVTEDELLSEGKSTGDEYYLERVKMGRILIDDEKQSFIFTMLMVSTCCGVNSGEFDFYRRFNIDPLEYSQSYCSDAMEKK